VLIKRFLLLLAIAAVPMVHVGCGASVSEGVADAPEQPEPEMSADERKAEMQAARSAAQ
jgi:hypothetical protein